MSKTTNQPGEAVGSVTNAEPARQPAAVPPAASPIRPQELARALRAAIDAFKAEMAQNPTDALRRAIQKLEVSSDYLGRHNVKVYGLVSTPSTAPTADQAVSDSAGGDT